jgi:hypothetical protein
MMTSLTLCHDSVIKNCFCLPQIHLSTVLFELVLAELADYS